MNTSGDWCFCMLIHGIAVTVSKQVCECQHCKNHCDVILTVVLYVRIVGYHWHRQGGFRVAKRYTLPWSKL